MLTRNECKALISGPGKFEGEPIYSPYYYDLILDGGSDEVNAGGGDVLIVTDRDRVLFPELEGIKKLVQYTDRNGFIYTVIPANDF